MEGRLEGGRRASGVLRFSMFPVRCIALAHDRVLTCGAAREGANDSVRQEGDPSWAEMFEQIVTLCFVQLARRVPRAEWYFKRAAPETRRPRDIVLVRQRCAG